jgi:hypothetical protein
MASKGFIESQKRGVDIILGIFVIAIGLMWIATAFDRLFNFGWGWDIQILWLGPLMIVWGFVIRFCARAIFKFVGSNS